ncbi:hypothetical protein [Ureibacillus chungkukjangi]|uniref:Uncharacterized protein n=1 Tax=Ureibacillus chungkukjangi TaxID=1202712 RepID=A0A318TD69_9BACL|nr:hypothetical protein [Ureibacillus chungkukjangi]PYF01770.1 hypothetical protein BJ095_1575 [Ureibacillus chungkukjangi]
MYFTFYKGSASSEYVIGKKNSEVSEINKKITETELIEKIVNELKERGYSPHGGAAYTIYSANKQLLTIPMYDIDLKNKEMTNKITAIIDEVIKENNFNSFEITIEKANP